MMTSRSVRRSLPAMRILTVRRSLPAMRILTVLAAVAAVFLALFAAPAASAAPLPGSSEAQLRDSVWEARNELHRHAGTLPAELADAARGSVDGVANGVFPGLTGERTQPLARTQAPAGTPRPNVGPCPASARACVDIDGRRTWLQSNGEITWGPVPMAPGKPGQDTPRGTFNVTRKVKDEVSYLFNMAPMPYAVYFTNNGHAFHEGNLGFDSAGCVRLNHADAVHYFNNLQIGDQVFIY